MNLFSFGGFFSSAIADVWMSIWLSLNDVVYSVIELLYKVFMAVADVNLFSDEAFKSIASRLYVVMGIAMLYIMAYNLIKMIINPEDKKTTGQMTTMIKEIMISLSLVILLPKIFSYMHIFQKNILESNIIGQIIIGDSGGTDDDCDYDGYTLIDDLTDLGEAHDESFLNWKTIVTLGMYQLYLNTQDQSPSQQLSQFCEIYMDQSPAMRGASTIAPTLFSAFFHPVGYTYYNCADYIYECEDDKDCETDYIETDDQKEMCAHYFYGVNMARFVGSLKPFNSDSKFYSKAKSDDDSFEFNYLLAFIAGILAIYMFACYSMAIGVRVAKLGFLQIISPIAVMMRIIPKKKEEVYGVWFKQLVDTYIDVFMRLVIIYFCLFSISLIPDIMEKLLVKAEGNVMVWVLSEVIVILGILKFAGDAPDLLKQFFKASGNFSLKSPKKQLSENKLAMGTIGAAGAMVKTGVGNGIRAFSSAREAGASKTGSALSALRHGIGGGAAGVFRGFKEGYKTGDLKDMNSAIDRAKGKSDERALKRSNASEARAKDGQAFIDEKGLPDNWFTRAIASNTAGRYQAVRRKKDAILDNVETWGGTSAYDDAKRQSNSKVKGYQSNFTKKLDKKGNVESSTAARDDIKDKLSRRELTISDLISRRFISEADVADHGGADSYTVAEMKDIVHKAFEKEINEGRAKALTEANGTDLAAYKDMTKLLTQAMKENADYLQNFFGSDGFIKDIGDKMGSALAGSGFEQAFSGSVEDFNKGLEQFIAKQETMSDIERKSDANMAAANAFAQAIDKIGKTADSNIERITIENKK